MTMNVFRARPRWVDEEPLIQSILHRFLDQLEQNLKPLLKISQRSTPELYDDNDDDPRYLWDLLKTLDNEYHIITVKKPRHRHGRESFENAQLFFNPDKEPQVRDWLNRPAFDPYTLTWHEAFQKVNHLFEDGGTALEHPLRTEGRSASEVLQAFAQLASEITTPQTLRNLSAKCFWGDSKYLDNKFELIQDLFPLARRNILPRPIMMNVALPDGEFDSLIFIENLDSFLMLKHFADKDPRFIKTALIYSAGFKGTSAHIRQRGEVVFSALSMVSIEAMQRFKAWWLQHDDMRVQCYFWGDMDYAGIGILKALKKSFPNTLCWQRGYDLMIAFHQRGLGHKIRDSKKMRQLDPGITGCAFADDTLLPLIRQTQRFLDQEVVALQDLQREQ